jgi:inosine triphosphate pyrophosphatase
MDKDDTLLNKKRTDTNDDDTLNNMNLPSTGSPHKTKKPKKKIIHFCSGNKNKYDELSRLFAKELPDIEIKQTDVDLPELQGYPEDIVKNKLKYALDTKAKGHPILVEDTSLCFNAYGGLPGAYVKYFITNLKPIGMYKMACAFDDHSAYAQSIFGLQKNKRGDTHIFIGRTDGEIVSPRGESNFGWDPCFLPNGCDKTYAEMTKDEKNMVSHRAKSVQKLIEFLKATPDFF